MPATISIHQVLSEIDDTGSGKNEFRLAWVRSAGKKRGSIKVVRRARRGPLKGYERNIPKKPRVGRRHVEKGTIPIVDVDNQQYMTLKISHIIEYNHFKVIH